MPIKKESRSCQNCERSLSGRSDKKFCSDQCRNEFNNHLKQDDNNYVRNITNALKKNRRLLQDLLTDKRDKMTVSKEHLTQEGFNFKFHTHSYTNKKGNVYYFCYEYGFLPLEKDLVLLVRRKNGE